MLRGDEIDKLSTLEVRTKEPLVKDQSRVAEKKALWGDRISWLQVANRPHALILCFGSRGKKLKIKNWDLFSIKIH